jgi:hypothetical protein
MARNRTPLAQAEATGAVDHNRKRFAGRKEPSGLGRLGDPPAHYTLEQIQLWNAIVARVPAGVLTSADCFIVELTVSLLGKLRAADMQRFATADDDVGREPVEEIKPPERAELRRCLASMGLTPADRTRVNGAEENRPPRSPPRAVQPRKG